MQPTDRTSSKRTSIASVGHAVFAVTLVGLGILGLFKREFAPIWEPVPKGVPARSLLIYLCALVPLVSGIGLLWQRAAAARVLLAFLLLWLLLLRLPLAVLSFNVSTWYSCCQTA